MTMDKKKLYSILRVVATNGNIKKLTREGIGYLEVGELMSAAKKKGYLNFSKSRISITKKGQTKLDELEAKYKVVDKSKWIEPEFKSRIPKLDKNFVYLPNQNDLFF